VLKGVWYSCVLRGGGRADGSARVQDVVLKGVWYS
jgi:hypothetical protein